MLCRRILNLAHRHVATTARSATRLQPSIACRASGLASVRLQSTHVDTYSSPGSASNFPPSLLQKSNASSRKAGTGSASSPAQAQDDDTGATAPVQVSRQEKAEIANHPSDSFHSLKGYVEYDIYKALVDKPFKFEKMSAVQEAVLGLLPELADPSARGSEKIVKEAQLLEDGSIRRGYRDPSTDLLVKAKTGTGKTLAFLVPALEARARDFTQELKDFKAANPDADKNSGSRHMAEYKKKSVGAIILSPTRELAAQIAGEAIRATHHLKEWGVQLFIGGASKGTQMREFSRGRRDIVVATPGRLFDMLQEPGLRPHLTKAKMLILDEADTLLDMGFKDAIKDITDCLPPREHRQTFMFSATMSKEVRQVARNTIRPQHTFIDTVPANEANAHLHIPQYHTVLPAEEQIPHIFRLLAQDALQQAESGTKGKAIVFLPTTKMTELFATMVSSFKQSLPWGSQGTRVFELHSRKSQAARDRAADDFRNVKSGYSILVTSDVSARGVDYPGVTRVIQVGIPPNKENYVHRLGRTGRAGKSGRGDIILLPWESRYVSAQLQDMPLQSLDSEVLKQDLEKLAADFDANPTQDSSVPQASSQDRKKRPFGRSAGPVGPSAIPTPCLPRLQDFETRLKEIILPNLSEEEVNEAFGSQMGFYTGHAHELQIRRSDVYQGLQEWAQGAFALENPPTVSASMMAKLGIGREKAGGGGRGGGGGGFRGYSAQNGRSRAFEDNFRQRRSGSDGGRGSSGKFEFQRPAFRSQSGDRGSRY